MKKRKADAKVVRRWARVLIIAFFVVVVLAVVLAIVGTMSSASAAEKVIGEGQALWVWVEDLNDLALPLIALLAVAMMIAAGVVYALDLGGGKQIGLAKEMIVAAISGMVLFMLALFLLREISGLFPPAYLNLTNTTTTPFNGFGGGSSGGTGSSGSWESPPAPGGGTGGASGGW